MIAIINYGLGNSKSIQNMLKKIGAEAKITEDISIIEQADKIILPGVGSFEAGMQKLTEKGLVACLNREVMERGKKVLGICLGAQLLGECSEEGSCRGFAWIKARSQKFAFEEAENRKIPNMGWQTVAVNKSSRLFEGISEPRFYFVHSYHICCEDEEDILASGNYGYDFVAALEHEHIAGVQFHPEKSHKYGMALLKNFVENF